MPELKNNRHEIFCQEYIVDFNGTRSAKAAGFAVRSAEVQASRMLRNDNIQSRIKELIKARKERIEINQDAVIQEMALLAFSDFSDYVEIEEGGGIRIKPFKEIPQLAARAIKKIKSHRIIKELPGDKQGEEMVLIDDLEYQLHDKIRPLIALGNHLGIKFEKFDVNGKMQHIMEAGITLKDLIKEFNANYGNGSGPPSATKDPK